MNVDNSRCGYDKSEFRLNLAKRIEPLLGSHEIEVEAATLSKAISKAFDDIGRDYDDLQSRFLSLTLWHIFAGDLLWIDCRTKAGNVLSDEVLLTAYSLWHKAARFAKNRDLDGMKAAMALDSAAQATADTLAKGNSVVNMRKYMFTVYRNLVLRRQNTARNVELVEGNTSDGGVFSARVEEKILSRELMDVMAPQERCVVMLRYHLDYGWDKIADILGTTVNAAQKRHSTGCRRAREYFGGDSGRPDVKKRKKRRSTK